MMRIKDLVIKIRFRLHYGFDPDTDKKALYLWDYKRHAVVCKLLCNPFTRRYYG